MLILRRGTPADGRWMLDYAETDIAQQMTTMVGGTLVPLGLTMAVSEAQALFYARQTLEGRKYGVRSGLLAGAAEEPPA